MSDTRDGSRDDSDARSHDDDDFVSDPRLTRQTDEGAQELQPTHDLVVTGGPWPEVEGEGDTMIINMGPQHPSTHGVLRLMLELDAETVVRAKPVVGYLHTGMEKTGEDEYKLQGTLTIKSVSKKIVLAVEFGGITKDPWGNTRTGFSVTGKINRQDYGMSFGAVSETGGLLLGDEVKINANVQLVKQAVAQAA